MHGTVKIKYTLYILNTQYIHVFRVVLTYTDYFPIQVGLHYWTQRVLC